MYFWMTTKIVDLNIVVLYIQMLSFLGKTWTLVKVCLGKVEVA